MNIIWDFNGTIIDDLDLCLNILNEMLADKGLKRVSKKRYLEIFTFPIKDYYLLAGFNFEGYTFEDIGKEFISKYQTASLSQPLHKGVLQCLQVIKDLGFKQYLLSASQKDNLLQQVKHFQIEKYFDEILGIDNILAKGKADIAVNYFQDHDINLDNTIIIGDTLHDAQVANTLKCDIILYTGGHQSYHRFTGFKTFNDYQQLLREIKTWQNKKKK